MVWGGGREGKKNNIWALINFPWPVNFKKDIFVSKFQKPATQTHPPSLSFFLILSWPLFKGAATRDSSNFPSYFCITQFLSVHT